MQPQQQKMQPQPQKNQPQQQKMQPQQQKMQPQQQKNQPQPQKKPQLLPQQLFRTFHYSTRGNDSKSRLFLRC